MSFRHQYHAHTFSFFSTNPRTNYVWIGHMFGGAVFECVDFSKWIVGEKITERYQICDDPPTGEASAVYHCLQVLGSDVGREGIMKIRMQVPYTFPPDLDPRDRAKLARPATVDGASGRTVREIHNLRELNRTGCTATPEFITYGVHAQGPLEAVPGGYRAVLILEKLPGKPLGDLWGTFSRDERIRALKGFEVAKAELCRHGAWHHDRNPWNIQYEPVSNKCWFLDYEDCTLVDDEMFCRGQNGSYITWGLDVDEDEEDDDDDDGEE